MNLNDAIDYLTRCADDNGAHWYQGRVWDDVASCPTCHGSDDAGHLGTPGSRYGFTSAHCAPIAYRVARINGNTDAASLDYIMGLVVNDSDTPEDTLRDYAIGLSGADVDAMVNGYLETQLWAQHDYEHDADNEYHDCDDCEHGENLDAYYSAEDISRDYVDTVRAEIADIVVAHPLAVRMYMNTVGKYDSAGNRSESFGHNLYLTREGHGTGFWDRGLGALGDYLTDMAKYAGSASDLWDDGTGTLKA